MVLQAKNPIIILLLLCILSVGCGKRKSSLETIVVNDKIVPMMHTDDFLTLVSDSGIIRYRITAKVCDGYVDNVPEPYWYFPKGIHVEIFDTLSNVEGSILADTGYLYEKQKLWKGIGNVKVVNLDGEKFETSELYLNEKDGSIYTDKFIRIERKGQIHTGYGLRSNTNMSDWSFLNHSGEIDIQEENPDSTRIDSISNKPARNENTKLIKQ